MEIEDDADETVGDTLCLIFFLGGVARATIGFEPGERRKETLQESKKRKKKDQLYVSMYSSSPGRLGAAQWVNMIDSKFVT